jgi:hypothetical protein
MANFTQARRPRQLRRWCMPSEKLIVWTFSIPSGEVHLWTSLRLRQNSEQSLHPRSPQSQKLALRPAPERFQLSAEALERRTIRPARSVRSESDESRDCSPLRGASTRVPCEALLFASPAPREIFRNRIGAFGWLRPSLKKIQSPILAVCPHDLKRNFINGLVINRLQTDCFVRSQHCEAPNCARAAQNITAQQCVYRHKIMQYKNVCNSTNQCGIDMCMFFLCRTGEGVVTSNSV